LAAVVEKAPETLVTVDLTTLKVTAGDVAVSVSLPDSARDALVSGQWDYLGRLLSAADQVTAHASTIPYLTGFSA